MALLKWTGCSKPQPTSALNMHTHTHTDGVCIKDVDLIFRQKKTCQIAFVIIHQSEISAGRMFWLMFISVETLAGK